MKDIVAQIRRFGLTALAVIAACFIGIRLWSYYMEAPWTRDGHVRADVVQVAPDVSGFVSEVLVRDNQQVELAEPQALKRWIALKNLGVD